MANNDKFGVLARTTELIEKHLQYTDDWDTLSGDPSHCDNCAGNIAELEKRYKTAEGELISFIKSKTRETQTLGDLTQLYRDSCKSFGEGLGKRLSLIKSKTVRIPFSAVEKLDHAVKKGFHWTPSQCSLMEELDNVLNFDGCFCTISVDCPTDTDALAALVLIKHLSGIGSNHLLFGLRNVFNSGCSAAITTSSWEGRSLIGYFTKEEEFGDGGDFKAQINCDFVNAFADRIAYFLANTNSDNPEYFSCEHFKELIYKRVLEAYFCFLPKPLQVFHTITRLVDLAGKAVITDTLINEQGLDFNLNCDILTERKSITGITYELNKTGLTSLFDTLEALGLSDMPGVKIVAEKVKQVA
jgi:hypothetical protein